jgi:putative membrane protein insertion efficiency factor
MPAGAVLAIFVRGYQLVLRPLFPAACRFEPSCSSYAIEALRTHGALRGLWLATRRILRCNPWGPSGYDPVPPCGHHHPEETFKAS